MPTRTVANLSIGRLAAVGLTLAVLTSSRVPGAAAQQPAPAWSFQDGEFAPADWSLTVLHNFADTLGRAEWRASGGHPGAYRRVYHSLPPGSLARKSEIVTVHMRRDAVYEPRRQGEIRVVCYEEDAFIFEGFAEGQQTGPALRQAYRWFIARAGVTGVPPDWLHTGPWRLAATDFVEVTSDARRLAFAHPDFSSAAPALTFGFQRSNTNTGHAYVMDGGIDNWSVIVNCDATPTPTPTGTPTSTPTLAPTPTATRAPTDSATPTRTATASPSATSTATGTATRTPRSTPTTSATATPPPRQAYLPAAIRHACLPREVHADVVLVVDVSTSMRRRTADGREKLAAVEDAAGLFLGRMDLDAGGRAGRDRIAVVGFNATVWIAQALTSDAGALRTAVAALRDEMREGTRLDLAVEGGVRALDGPGRRPGNTAAVVLLTDGLPNGVPTGPGGTQGETVVALAAAARGRGIHIYAIGVGLPGAPDTADRVDMDLLRAIAGRPKDAFQTFSAVELARIYGEIAYALGCPGGVYWRTSP